MVRQSSHALGWLTTPVNDAARITTKITELAALGSGVYGASGTGATNITGEPNVGWPVSSLFMYDQAITRISGGADWVFRPKDIRNWWANAHQNRRSGNPLLQPTARVPQSKPVRFTELGSPAVDRGTNQPNVFYDPKSAESALPHFSRGWQDEAIQRRYIEAMLGYWGDPANNQVSSGYAGPMIDMGEAAVWTWDVRPYPDFPARDYIWADAPNWRPGHWLNGRLGAVGLFEPADPRLPQGFAAVGVGFIDRFVSGTGLARPCATRL